RRMTAPSMTVLATGPLTTVQDAGRPGRAAQGIGSSGACDRASYRLANRLVGNAETAATVEFTFGGLDVRLRNPATVAFTGAYCPGGPGWRLALTLPAGYRLTLQPPATGLRSYLAVRGGVAIEPVLGSRATDLLSGLGPPVLQPGMLLPVGTEVAGEPCGEAAADPDVAAGEVTVEVLPGPRTDWFTDPRRLFGRAWTVQPDSNRIGIRLAGEPVQRSRAGELPPEPMLPGAIQVPPDGLPIVLFRDAPVTGGYPVIGVLPERELDRVAQLRPGDTLRLVPGIGWKAGSAAAG
ncbi:MAG TPA: biotin-dependent carboxyltransferase family protein, partial [Jatrophihabitans sp.]|nr:biotin-dependent carboxyltransferase family protein [Jatrophihabitans sp.]